MCRFKYRFGTSLSIPPTRRSSNDTGSLIGRRILYSDAVPPYAGISSLASAENTSSNIVPD